LDTSGSIRKADYVKEKQFVYKVADFLGFSNLQYGVVLFSHQASMDIKFTDFTNFQSFKEAVTKLPQSHSITRIDRGLLVAKNKLFTDAGGHRPNANKVLFLLTDGSQTYSTDAVDNALISQGIRYAGTELFVLGVGRGIQKSELVDIAGGKERVFIAKDFDTLTSSDFINQFNVSCSKFLFLLPFL